MVDEVKGYYCLREAVKAEVASFLERSSAVSEYDIVGPHIVRNFEVIILSTVHAISFLACLLPEHVIVKHVWVISSSIELY